MTLPEPPRSLVAAPLVGDWIAIMPSGRIIVLTGRVELGQGNVSAIRRMAATELGCSPDAIAITSGRTGLTPDEGFTAGSMSIVLGGQAVRWAASALREMILDAAARGLGIDRIDLRLADGSVLAGGNPVDLDLPAVLDSLDLDVPVTRYARPLPAAERAGLPDTPRLDLMARLAGTPFIHDLERPDMLFGRSLHPPTMTAQLVHLDIEALRRRPGVVAVHRDGSFVGIIAETEIDAVAAARQARRQADWADTGPVLNDAMMAIEGADGTADRVVDEGAPPVAGRRFSATVRRPFLLHASIGPAAAVAQWTDAGLSVWTHSQGVYPLRRALAMVFEELAEEHITVIHHPGAGCYGHNGADDVAP